MIQIASLKEFLQMNESSKELFSEFLENIFIVAIGTGTVKYKIGTIIEFRLGFAVLILLTSWNRRGGK